VEGKYPEVAKKDIGTFLGEISKILIGYKGYREEIPNSELLGIVNKFYSIFSEKRKEIEKVLGVKIQESRLELYLSPFELFRDSIGIEFVEEGETIARRLVDILEQAYRREEEFNPALVKVEFGPEDLIFLFIFSEIWTSVLAACGSSYPGGKVIVSPIYMLFLCKKGGIDLEKCVEREIANLLLFQVFSNLLEVILELGRKAQRIYFQTGEYGLGPWKSDILLEALVEYSFFARVTNSIINAFSYVLGYRDNLEGPIENAIYDLWKREGKTIIDELRRIHSFVDLIKFLNRKRVEFSTEYEFIRKKYQRVITMTKVA